ncbi:MAG: hypothetical protein ABJF50_16495 [Paracoccaceae bacterium]
MRMIGIGLTGFLLAGIALLLSSMNILEKGQHYVREITGGPHLVFEHRTPARAQDVHQAVISRANPDHPVILSGLPAYQSVAFIMPVDARPTSGYLQIDATLQVLDGVEGVLRISIQNTRRGEMLLRPGEGGRSLQIPLSPTDFAGGKLVVSFSLQGTGLHLQCGPKDGVEAVVEIETTSAVYVTLDRPLQTERDQVHAWGNVVHVDWPGWLKKDDQLRRLVLATQLQRRGISPVFTTTPDAGLKTAELRAVLPEFPVIQATWNAQGDLALGAANIGLRRFYRQAAWRQRFDLGADAAQYLPTHVDLHMRFGRLLGDQHWAMTVALNERLVFQEHVPGAQTGFQASIDLPADILGANNTLEVVVTSTSPRRGDCDRGPELVAEMLPKSQLIVGDALFVSPLSELHAALENVGPVNVAMASGLTATDAKVVSRLLDQVIPIGAEFKPAGKKVHIHVLSPAHPVPALPDDGPIWLVRNDGVTQDLSISELEAGKELSQFGVALLVTPYAITLGEAEG